MRGIVPGARSLFLASAYLFLTSALFLVLAGALLLLSLETEAMAVESLNFRIIQEEVVSGFGSGGSAAFVTPRSVVGQNAAGRLKSANFLLNLGSQEEIVPPGGSGTAIDVKGTVDDDTASVVAKALNSVNASVSQGTWLAQGVWLAEGANTITVTATNGMGTSTTKEVHVIVDTIPPARPTLKAVATPTATSPQALSGTKEANTSLWINGKEVVPTNSLTTWSHDLTLAQGKNPIELWAKDRAGNSSTHVTAQIIYDATPPSAPVVADDGRFTLSLTQLHARWSSQEDDTEIAAYAYAIGTTPGVSNTVAFTDVGNKTEVTHSGLTLSEGTKYYVTVKATNTVGLISNVGSSDGIRVNAKPPVITGATPSDGSKFYPTTLVPCSITATDPSGDPLQCRFLLDGQVVRDWSSSPDFTLDTAAFSSGLKTLRMEVQDPFDGEDARAIELYLFRRPIKAKE